MPRRHTLSARHLGIEPSLSSPFRIERLLRDGGVSKEDAMEPNPQDDAVNTSPEEAPTDAVTDEVKRSEVDETGQVGNADDLAEAQTEGPDET